ncbi:AAA family ATPase [Spongisporangium articulatum]|uniref:AAA family ATPase n=1 Tax=Spongisporangium articulatum TaxID=3362603 RepID=A0ABW8ALX5_9ACTN
MPVPMPVPALRADVARSSGVVETHCATVFFTGDLAVKVKKALDLGFVDWRTGAARERACRDEVTLNRRFAPDVYLGVADVRLTQRPDGTSSPDACEWAVVMRRMPGDRRLSALIAAGEDVDDGLRVVARLLAAHHATARRSGSIDAQGTPEALGRRWTDNLDALDGFVGRVVDPEPLEQVRELALRYVAGRHRLLTSRIEHGHVRDGHGDLLADDIFCLDDGPRVLDCLEFDPALRALDALDDAACLAMDLERLGAGRHAVRFLRWFGEFSGDPGPAGLGDHYVAYRATMRAKVAALRWAQGDAAAADTARQLVDLALRRLRRAEPRMVLVGGAPGTGKSTVAAGVADRMGAVLLRSDRIRKESAGLDPLGPAGAALGRGLYTPAATDATYATMIARAGELLGLGESVVLDATWGRSEHRWQAEAVATATASRLEQFRCRTSPATARDRLARRRGDASDAGPAVGAALAAAFEPWPEAQDVDTEAAVEDSVQSVVGGCT